jgi:hypothetical protein
LQSERVGLAIAGIDAVHTGFHRQAIRNCLERLRTKLRLRHGLATSWHNHDGDEKPKGQHGATLDEW